MNIYSVPRFSSKWRPLSCVGSREQRGKVECNFSEFASNPMELIRKSEKSMNQTFTL
ncbi:hypothetical protein B566_EDAN008817 [Ephemera danica]|nr:hypothetical protein B566_EDAN008817 [Ephemera danica]